MDWKNAAAQKRNVSGTANAPNASNITTSPKIRLIVKEEALIQSIMNNV